MICQFKAQVAAQQLKKLRFLARIIMTKHRFINFNKNSTAILPIDHCKDSHLIGKDIFGIANNHCPKGLNMLKDYAKSKDVFQTDLTTTFVRVKRNVHFPDSTNYKFIYLAKGRELPSCQQSF